MSAASPLNPKQQRFVAEYLIDLNATQAAIRAGYSARTAEQGGAQLLRNIKVAGVVKDALAARAGKLEITAGTVLANIEAVRVMAMADKEYGPALRACELQGKHLGLFRSSLGDALDDPIDITPEHTPERDAARRILLAFALRVMAGNGAKAPALPSP